MDKENMFFKKCPNRQCNIISGFILHLNVVKKNEKYICGDCGKEFKLNKWIESTEKDYIKQLSDREIDNG